MEQGTANRTMAATNMNASSSRAHTLVCISFDQLITRDGCTTRLSSNINFVDLAGSERADSTGSTGDRLKEGANINRSLSALGNVISALVENKKVVPYRDSVLTKLLQNALGGNSKTVMIAALSPADINYMETLSTLRYADRVKQIKTKAVVNDRSQDSMIKELLAENARLKQQLLEITNQSGVASAPGLPQEERTKTEEGIRTEIMAQLENNTELLEIQDQKAFLKKLEEARKEASNMKLPSTISRSPKSSPNCPYLSNLNEDPQLSGVIIYSLDADKIVVGREGAPGNLRVHGRVVEKDGKKTAYILLRGLNIQDTHATFTRLQDGRMELSVGTNSTRSTKVNGTILTTSQILKPMDRILFGSYHLYVYHNESQKAKGIPDHVDWDFAQKELAKCEGIDQFDKAMGENERCALQQQLIELIPMLQEVNCIAKEMDKRRIFDIVLLPPLLQRTIYGQRKTTKIVVRMKCLETGNIWMWERGKFLNRRFLIQEMYHGFDSEGDQAVRKQEDDPFWEPLEPLLVGFAPAFLQPLAYGLDYVDRVQISDLDGQSIGKLSVSLQ
uniref:Kinesin motor domain-containing protein n=1 Tax=Mesocestoides corti TaxID=53468 RepID=A0A5K3ENU8_MESCO